MILVGCRAPATTAAPKAAPAASCHDACACGVDDDVAALIRCGDGPAALDVQAHALLEAPSVATTLGLVEIAWTFELDASARALLERLPALSTERYLGLGLLDLHAYVGAREDPRFEAAEGNLRRALASEEARQHALAGIVLLYLARGGGPGPELDRAGLLCRQNLATAAALASACARIAYARDEPALGRERYQQAIELDPHHYAAWLALGQAELQVGNLEVATRSFTEARVADSPRLRYEALLGLGVALQRQGARAQAVDAYREAGRAHALLAAAPPVALLYNLGALLIDGAPAERVEGRSLLEAYLAHPDADDVRSSRAHQLLDEAPTR